VLHTLGPGGAQELLVTLAAVAASQDIDLSVVVLKPSTGLAHADRLRGLGVPLRSLDLRGVADLRGAGRLRTALRELRPDIVHTHGRHADVLAAVVAPRLGLPRLSTLHLVESRRRRPRGLVAAGTARARTSRGGEVIAVSAYQQAAYAAAYPAASGRARLVYNGVPVPAATAPAEIDAPGAVVLAAGLLRPDRGHSHLLEAAGLLRTPATVLVAGDGPLREQLELQVAGQQADVRLLGFRSDVTALLARADVLAHPSLTDALPTAVLHAMANGVPVVASRVGGIPELVSEDVGVLVPAGDPVALAAALDDLLADGERRKTLGAAGRRRFAAEFTDHAWAARLRDVYDDVLTDSSPSR
jgi:glycosyltransferase involved in cell wall biosynthesis